MAGTFICANEILVGTRGVSVVRAFATRRRPEDEG